MTLPTFNPPIAPSPGTPHTPKINLFKAEFGDGYTQSSPNGLNHIKQMITLRWEGLTEDQFRTIRDFFEGRGGYRPFLYQPRGRDEVTRWVCEEWSATDATPWAFEAKLGESFPGRCNCEFLSAGV